MSGKHRLPLLSLIGWSGMSLDVDPALLEKDADLIDPVARRNTQWEPEIRAAGDVAVRAAGYPQLAAAVADITGQACGYIRALGSEQATFAAALRRAAVMYREQDHSVAQH